MARGLLLRGVIATALGLLVLLPNSVGGAVWLGRKATLDVLEVGEDGKESYAVIFDAGSSGSRVHVFRFGEKLELLHVGNELELFKQVRPGLSSYADDPQEAANSLVPLLKEAENVVPKDLRATTPIILGATAGLRSIGEEKSEAILQAVKDLLRTNSSLEYKPEWVSVIRGSEEGSYLWVAVNYLLGNLGKKYPGTVGVVDMGGASVQMAYAISEKAAAKAPKVPSIEDPYVTKLFLNGTTYYIYVHSYLHYGIFAARAEILKAGVGSYSYCTLRGFKGVYEYNGEVYKASASPLGSSFTKCRDNVLRALKVNKKCTYTKCTFDGVWNGGGGAGQRHLYVASSFYFTAAEVGLVGPDVPATEAKPADLKKVAKRVCKLSLEEARTIFPTVAEKDLPYLCMDLVYESTLLVEGFDLEPRREITLVDSVKYGDSYVKAAWPLGTAIEAMSLHSAIASAVKNLVRFWL